MFDSIKVLNQTIYANNGLKLSLVPFIILFFISALIRTNALDFCGLSELKDKVLIVTGGKKIDTTAFLLIFDSIEELDYDTISKPRFFENINSILSKQYSAYVFYDSYAETKPREDSIMIELARRGTGMLFLHHAITSHQNSPEFKLIVGGRYHHKPWYDGLKKYGPSTYKHDQEFSVKILDKSHPVTMGIPDFQIHDETYLNIEYIDKVIPLLGTDNRESVKFIGWTHMYHDSKVVYLQPGHNKKSFENRYFRLLVKNSLYWLMK